MPGLVGCVSKSPDASAPRLFRSLLGSMKCQSRLQIETAMAADGEWALGHLRLHGAAPDRSIADKKATVTVMFHGVLHNADELIARIRKEENIDLRGGHPKLIAHLYKTRGNYFVRYLKGAFVVALIDDNAKKAIVVTDRLGSYPIYWSKLPSRLVFASELKAVLRDPQIKAVLNPRAVADYFAFGFLFGDKTLAENISLVPPGSILTYSWEDGVCTIESYFCLEELFEPVEEERSRYTQELVGVFNSCVTRAVRHENRVGMSLSGGLDSRALLSAINGHPSQISTYTLGVKGCADEVIAAKLAKIAGTRHDFLELDTRYLTDGLLSLRRMVSLTDGMYLTHGLTENLAVQFLDKAGYSVLLRGHGGELAKASLAWPLHTDQYIHRMQSKDEFVSYLLGRVNYISAGIPFRELFEDSRYEHSESGARTSLEKSVAGVSLSPADLCSYLYLNEQHRRFTIASLELFRNFTEVRMPFVDEEFLRILFRCPAEWRTGTDIHRAIIKANDPSMLRIRNSNTGAPAGAGPLSEKFFDKINTLFRRLNLYGYRHYHSFERWMRDMLLESVNQVVLGPESLARGIYRESTLRRLLKETQHGVADHAYLLQILLTLELWQRENA